MLWKALFDLLGVSSKTVKMTADERVIRNIRKDGAVRMDALVELCNNYRLDIRQFFVKAGEEMPLELSKVQKKNVQTLGFRRDLIPSVRERVIARHTDVLDAMNTYGVTLEDIFCISPVEETEQAPQPQTKAMEVESDELVFNCGLFGALPHILSATRIQIGKDSGHAVTLWQRTVESRNIAVQSLVDVCNTFHIDINAFWQSKHNENIVIPDNEWQPIEFHSERLRRLYVGKDAQENMTSICAKTGFNRMRLERYTKNPTAMQADDMIHLCKTLGITPGYFYDAKYTVASGKVVDDMRRQMEIAKNAEDRKNIENQQLQSRIRHLEAMLEMKKK